MAKARWPAIFAIAIFLNPLATGSWVSGCRKAETASETYERIVRTIDHGDLNTSLTDVEKALSNNVGNSVEWRWRFLILKARILISRSSFQDALKLLDEELPASLASSDVAVRKHLMEGIAYRNGQDFRKSEGHLEEALSSARSAQPKLECEVLRAIGELQVDEKKYPEADASFRRALELAGREHRQDQVAATLVNLARLSTSEEHFGEAIDLNQSALVLARSLDMQGLVATILGNTAWSYYELGDFERARSSFKEAAEAAERVGQTGYSLYWRTGVADADIALHDLVAARSLFTDTLASARGLNDTVTITVCLNGLAGISLRTDHLDEAASYNQEALRIQQAGLDHSGTLRSSLQAARIEAGSRNFTQAEKLFQNVLRDAKADTSLRWEAAARLAKVHDDEGLPEKAEEEYRQSIRTIEAARAAITQPELRLSFLSGGIEFYDDYIEFLIARGRLQDALKAAELSRAQTLEEGLGPAAQHSKISGGSDQFEAEARRLGATLLFYWIGSKHSHLWAIAPKTITYFPLPPAPEIDSAVKSYREAVVQSEDVAQAEQAAGEKLYAMLLAPAEKLIPRNSRVVLLPDGSLYTLNFETLIVPAPVPHFWIEDVTLTTASSLSLLASSAQRVTPKQKSLLLVGDAFKATDEFTPLSQAEVEMQAVQRYFPDSNRMILRREQATPGAYMSSNPERFAYLHFVTHGTASRLRPLDSAVILSKEPGSDSYKLYARDILTRHLNAELVTISACNGAGTRAYAGEGLVGLSWAFLRAGAHHVIGALWEVSNAPSTAEFMDLFYRGLSRGQDVATALREAKLSFLHSSNTKSAFKKPYYWAPFQLYAGS